jgi:hypothetical protein
MEREPLDFDALLQERHASAAATIRPMTLEAVREQITKLFPNPDHPWQAVVDEFLTSHKNTTAVHGSTTDGVEFIFFPHERKGLWFKVAGGVQGAGPILERGLAALSEIAKEKGLA